jgi:hypothetical protein
MRRLRALLRTGALTLALAGQAQAWAQSAPPADGAPPVPDQPEQTPPVDTPSQLLYRDALQSIAEGRNNDASETLSRVIDSEPMHAGAWLDLGLIQCALGHGDEAERLFATIETRFDPPPGILELIANARTEGCKAWQPHSQLTLLLARGWDQNVNQGSTGSYSITGTDGLPVDIPLTADFRPRHDQYTLASVDYLRDLSSNGTIAFLQLQARRDDRIAEYNTNSLFAGVETPWRLRDWTLRGTAMVGLTTLGGQLYQKQGQLQGRITPPLPLPGSVQVSFSASLTHLHYLTLDNFDSNTIEAGGQLTYRGKNDYASAALTYLEDRATGQRPGGDRSGTLANLLWRRGLGMGLTGELGLTRQTWNSVSAYSPGLIDQVRDQDTRVLRAALSYPVGRSQVLKLELREVHNQENISIFQYNDRQIQFSWQWQGL